jgi:hypothetical protein
MYRFTILALFAAGCSATAPTELTDCSAPPKQTFDPQPRVREQLKAIEDDLRAMKLKLGAS